MVVTMVLLVSGANGVRGQVHERAAHPLGTVDFPVSCSEQAQVEFNRAIALLHHMTYARARDAFQQVAKTDPRCAMAHWGLAMTLFQRPKVAGKRISSDDLMVCIITLQDNGIR